MAEINTPIRFCSLLDQSRNPGRFKQPKRRVREGLYSERGAGAGTCTWRNVTGPDADVGAGLCPATTLQNLNWIVVRDYGNLVAP
jgi:hypothetical protein